MASLAVYLNPNPGSRPAIPFLLEVQTELLAALATCVVVPLYRPAAAPEPRLTRLAPLLTFQGHPYVAMVPELAGIPRRQLGKAAGALGERRAEILAALDLLFTGI